MGQTPKSNSTSTAAAAAAASTTAMSMSLCREFMSSTDLLFQSKLTWLLAFGPLAIVGSSTGMFSEALCFACSGIALIPCAERLSFVTEQVAEHTNGTIGALLNATFGNAPELLISIAALRAGYYRVIQLAMLGSMLTNMILVFGIACIIGGLRWQVQEVRQVSGHVNVIMLWVATAGSLFPAALKLSGQIEALSPDADVSHDNDQVTPEEVTFCRVNAAVMLILYLFFLLFQLGTHKEEYDEEDPGVLAQAKRSRRNLMCLLWAQRAHGYVGTSTVGSASSINSKRNNNHDPDDSHLDEELALMRDDEMAGTTINTSSLHSRLNNSSKNQNGLAARSSIADMDEDGSERTFENEETDLSPSISSVIHTRRRRNLEAQDSLASSTSSPSTRPSLEESLTRKSKTSDSGIEPHDPPDFSESEGDAGLENGREVFHDNNGGQEFDDNSLHIHLHPAHVKEGPLISMKVGVMWLFVITVCISAMSDILVDTIDGFARRFKISEVFTSMVIIPFFSNVAEQVSAFLFAYRNEMDLCIGVTVGSAIQIATFVLPGSVLIAGLMDRPMTLFFRSYETVALFFSVIVVGAILQGGTTNWMTGVMLVGIYIMISFGVLIS